LVIGEIVGAQSTIDDNFYRGKVLKKIDDATYLLQFIDFGDKDNVPLSKIFEIPKHFMVIYSLFVSVKYMFRSHYIFRFFLFIDSFKCD